MCMDGDILDSRIWKNYETNIFFTFSMSTYDQSYCYAWTCVEQPRIYKEHIRTFKHIQGNLNNYYHALILNSHHDNIKNKLGKVIKPSCKIHMVDEETLGEGPVSLNTLSLRKTKIW